MTDRTLRNGADLDNLAFDDRGLLPVVAQDGVTGRVLMTAWANREALERSLDSGELHFWSRSRGRLWKKGEASGNVLRVRSLHGDCDGDTVLALVEPAGPACHTGETSCFGEAAGPGAEAVLPGLWATLSDRAEDRPERSDTVRLRDDPNLRMTKLGEETAELIGALAQDDGKRSVEEAADLLYHVLVALLGAGASLDELLAELEERR